jgi:hypothetical protein
MLSGKQAPLRERQELPNTVKNVAKCQREKENKSAKLLNPLKFLFLFASPT